MAQSFTIKFNARPVWDKDGKCFVILEWQGGRRDVLRCREADKQPDPADWWKQGQGDPDDRPQG